jgi:hypothetical protein
VSADARRIQQKHRVESEFREKNLLTDNRPGQWARFERFPAGSHVQVKKQSVEKVEFA